MTSIVPPIIRILVVDDEPALREMLEIMLGREGFGVVSAPGYTVALEAIGKRPVGRFDKPHEYEITGTERPRAAAPEPTPAAPATTPRKRARKRGS